MKIELSYMFSIAL